MPVDGETERVIERRVVEPGSSSTGAIASAVIVLGVIAAVALGWWVVGTAPAPDNRTSQSPSASAGKSAPSATLPDEANPGKSL